MEINGEGRVQAVKVSSFWTLESAGIDWITIHLADTANNERARARVALWQLREQSEGNYVKGWSLAGYNGSQCGGVAYGERRGQGVVQVTSAKARKYATGILALGGRVSRIDLEATFIARRATTQPADEAYRGQAESGRVGRKTIMRTAFRSTDGGATTYVGAPSSESRMRVYDKGVEEKTHPQGMRWRWEIQSRRIHARSLAARLILPDVRGDTIPRILKGFCTKNGVPFPAGFDGMSTAFDSRPKSDVLDTMHWLQVGVQPALARLAAHVDIGHVLRTLGVFEAAGEYFHNNPTTGGGDERR